MTARSDVFAWGGLVAFAGTGRQPFGDGPGDALAYRTVHEQPYLGDIGGPLRAFVEAAMAKDPERRPSARDLLDHLLTGDSGARQSLPAIELPPRPSVRAPSSESDSAPSADAEATETEFTETLVVDPDRKLPRRSRRNIATAVGVSTAAVVAALAVVLASSGGGSGTQTANGSPTTSPNVAPSSVGQSSSGASTGSPLGPTAPGEFIFGEEQVEVDGRRYTRLASRLDDGCPDITGPAADVLTGEVCTQLARAVYRSQPPAGASAVLTGVSVLVTDTASAAETASESFRTARRAWPRCLSRPRRFLAGRS